MQIVQTDRVTPIPPGQTPHYNTHNPLLRLLNLTEEIQLAAEREYYVGKSVQYLIPFSYLELYGPQGDAYQITDPRLQDSKTDFQKQNIKDFYVTDTYLARGWAHVAGQDIPFLQLSYNG